MNTTSSAVKVPTPEHSSRFYERDSMLRKRRHAKKRDQIRSSSPTIVYREDAPTGAKPQSHESCDVDRLTRGSEHIRQVSKHGLSGLLGLAI